MAKLPVERLTARQRECLRLVAANHTTKEIALMLGLSPNTIDGYVSEARDILGATSRRDAARVFLSLSSETHPQSLRGQFSRVDGGSKIPPDQLGRLIEHRELATELEFGSPRQGVESVPKAEPFHWFRGGREHNSLSSGQRLLWIAAGSLFAAIMFIVAIASIDALARLLSV